MDHWQWLKKVAHIDRRRDVLWTQLITDHCNIQVFGVLTTDLEV